MTKKTYESLKPDDKIMRISSSYHLSWFFDYPKVGDICTLSEKQGADENLTKEEIILGFGSAWTIKESWQTLYRTDILRHFKKVSKKEYVENIKKEYAKRENELKYLERKYFNAKEEYENVKKTLNKLQNEINKCEEK